MDRRLPSNLGLRPLLMRFEQKAHKQGAVHRGSVACRPVELPELARNGIPAPQTCSCSNETLWDIPLDNDQVERSARVCAVCDMAYAWPRFGGDPYDLRRDGLAS